MPVTNAEANAIGNETIMYSNQISAMNPAMISAITFDMNNKMNETNPNLK